MGSWGESIILQESKKNLDKNKKRFAIDSNIFRNLNFINYLTLTKSNFSIFIPTIVQLEIGYFYRASGISWEQFREDINKFEGVFLEWDNNIIPEVIDHAFMERNHLPFKKHFRDFLIGVECKKIPASLITYNIKHFTWLKTIEIYTPEDFLLKFNPEK